MDMFGSDDENENENGEQPDSPAITSDRNEGFSLLSQGLFIEAMKFKPFQRKIVRQDDEFACSDENLKTEIILNRRVGLISISQPSVGEALQSRLRAMKFQNSKVVTVVNADTPEFFDFVAICEMDADQIRIGISIAESCLLPGGVCVLQNSGDHSIDELTWIQNSTVEADTNKSDSTSIFGLVSPVKVIRKRSIDCNIAAAQYWSQSAEAVERERDLLERITIPLSVAERSMSILSDASHQKAVEALKAYGVIVFKGLVNAETVLNWGRAAKTDMNHVVQKLLERDIDLLEPRENQWISNYHEMSMREAFRCDLRNGISMKRMQSGREPSGGTVSSNETKCHSSVGNQISKWSNLRESSIVSEVLLEVMNPSGGEDAKGNWGRYNFEEGGPDIGPPPLKVGEIGCVMSVPGCIDQTIHSDAPHLYVHTQLPGHYYNLFMPALETQAQCSHYVGQTAYIAGSHILKTCADMMVREGGQELLEANLLRPHMQTGDALIFDTRILHMGLSNRGNEHPSMEGIHAKDPAAQNAWRPMMYVNYHQKWFHDPKNWNDAEKLF